MLLYFTKTYYQLFFPLRSRILQIQFLNSTDREFHRCKFWIPQIQVLNNFWIPQIQFLKCTHTITEFHRYNYWIPQIQLLNSIDTIVEFHRYNSWIPPIQILNFTDTIPIPPIQSLNSTVQVFQNLCSRYADLGYHIIWQTKVLIIPKF